MNNQWRVNETLRGGTHKEERGGHIPPPIANEVVHVGRTQRGISCHSFRSCSVVVDTETSVRRWCCTEENKGITYSLKHLAMNARADFFPFLAFCSLFRFFFFFLLSFVPGTNAVKKSETKEERKAKRKSKYRSDAFVNR